MTIIAPEHRRGRREAARVAVRSVLEGMALTLVAYAIFVILFSPSHR